MPGQIISKSTLTALKPSAEQQKQLDDLQKEVDAKLDKLLNADQKKQLKEARENFGQGGPFGGPPGGPAASRRARVDRQRSGQGGPPRGPGGPIMGNTLFRAYRYGPDFPGLAGKVLKPGKTIEEMEAVKKANEAKKSQETAKK